MAERALAWSIMPPQKYLAIWLSSSGSSSSKKAFFPPFQRLTLVCMPLPASMDMGLGIMVATFSNFWATFLTMNL